MGWREERVARNETLFREVNERIKQVNTALATAEQADFLCECGDQECTQPISLTVAEYEAVRRDATHFAVSPGHVVPEIEVVLAENDRYAVVAKVDLEAAEIAEERDPRS